MRNGYILGCEVGIMARLLFSRGSELLIDYRLRPGRTSIGRADSCDVSLPGDEVSRTHCFIDGRGESWEVIDRSRHGTVLDGTPIKRGLLRDGAKLAIGPYIVELRSRESDNSLPTAESPPDREHELVVASDDAIHIERAVLAVVAGAEPGRRYELRSSRVSLGAAPSPLNFGDPVLVPDHCRLRVSRGRVMLEPGAGPTYLDGARIRDITPLYIGEEFRIGQTILRLENAQTDEVPTAARFGDMVGDSAQMKRLFGMLRRMAAHHFPVLITGESGTGKELAARGIHDNSPRMSGPFVPMNCGAIPEALFESELFGHEKGSFTGALRRADGAFQRADGGTLFLDEIGELPEASQAKMLRVLESGEVRRVGGADVEFPDVRIVAATNRDLAGEVRRGTFREDLFFRLAVLSIHIPPLRRRPEDIEALALAICKHLHTAAHLTPEAIELLNSHDWPGNVRELRNVLTRAYVLGGARIDSEHITFHDLTRPPAPASSAQESEAEDTERAYLLSVLRRHGDNRTAAAREMGIARSTLHYKMKRLNMA